MATSSLPSFTELADALLTAESHFHPSQVHGLFCAFICANPDSPDNLWKKVLPHPKKHPAAQALLKDLHENSYHHMSQFSFEFSLFLPDDDTDINSRTESLGLWCQGFVAGLEQSGMPTQNQPPSEVADAINDLIEIAQVSYEDLTESDEEETAYFELVEYVRLAVLMIFHELKSSRSLH